MSLSSSIRKLVFKIPITNIKWKCCISGDIIDTSFLEVIVDTYRNISVEFIEFMRDAVNAFKEHVESRKCTIAEELALAIRDALQEKYSLHIITVKLVFLEKDNETGIVATIEVEA